MARKHHLYLLIGIFTVAAILFITTRFNLTGRFEGIYILKGPPGKLFELKDDLYLGDGCRVLYAIDFDSIRRNFLRKPPKHKPGEAYLDFEWDSGDGSGYVWNYMPDGRKMLTCFSRFESSSGKIVHGLFVGGGLPEETRGDDLLKMNETGMAYYDGKRWYHVWCNVNEAIASEDFPTAVIPAEWEFLGSSVLRAGLKSVLLTSSHRVVLAGVPFRVDRFAHFRAGDTFFILTIRVTNIGDHGTSFFYGYGDEPWVGNYGSSEGNVGWVKDRLIKYEGHADPGKYTYAGYFDYGNDAIGEAHTNSNIADFIEWFGDDRPDDVFFSNTVDEPDEEKNPKPLYSDTRFIGLQWGPTPLAPGDSRTYILAIGMAGYDPKTGFPVKPPIKLGVPR